MATRRRTPQQRRTSSAGLIVAVSVAACLGAFFARLPGVAVLFAGLIFAAWAEPQPELTGTKGTPANEAEQAKLDRYHLWSDLRLGVFSPTAVSPGWPVRGSFLVAVLAGIGAFGLPVFSGWARLADAVCAFLAVSVVTEVRRRNANPERDHPGVRIDTLPRVRPTLFAIGGGVAVVVVVAGILTRGLLDGLVGQSVPQTPGIEGWAAWWLGFRPEWASGLWWMTISSVAVLAGLAVVGKPWCDAALADWRRLVDARATWNPRWTQLKMDPTPQVVAIRTASHPTGVTAEDVEFRCPPHLGFADFENLAPKVHPMVGQGTSVSILPVPETGPDGPIPGSVHPAKFRVVVFPSPAPDVAEPGTSVEWAELFLTAATRQAVSKTGYPRPVLTSCQQVPTGAETPPAGEAPGQQDRTLSAGRPIWFTQWTWADGLPLKAIERESGPLAATARTHAQVDAVESDGIFFGALEEAPPELAALLDRRRTDDEWAARWGNVKAVQLQNPAYQHNTYKELALADGGVLSTVGFMTRQGQDPRQFRTATMENALRPAMGASLTFLSISAWRAPGRGPGAREGERHHGAFRLSWSTSKVPATPSTLRQCPAATYLLTGMVNRAFDAVKTPRPEVLNARPLTVDDAYGQLWAITLRLYDGVTSDQVRGQLDRLKTLLGVEWVRVETTDEGCILYAGDAPGSVELARPQRDEPHLIALDWEQAWRNSGVKGVAGALPKLMGPVTEMPKNPNIKVLDYQLPDSVEIGEVREKKVRNRLGNQTGNGWVAIRSHPDVVGAIRVLCAEQDPMPSTVPYDFNAAHSPAGIPFATGEDGEPIAVNLSDSPHLLCLGLTGSGKSAFAANLVYGMLTGGCDVVAIDPTKGAADFAWADDWLLFRAGAEPGQTQIEAERVAAATMQALYAEGKRRIRAYQAEGKVKASEMADPPRPIVVFFDEFAGVLDLEKRSAIGTQPVDDPRLEQARLERLETRELKMSMGLDVANTAAELRSANIHLVLLTQRLTAKLLEDMPKGQTLRTNMARIILGKASAGDKMSALRLPDLAPEHGERIPKGRGIYEPLDGASMLMQGWFATPDEFGEQLRRTLPPKAPSDKLDITPYLKQPDEQSEQVGVARPVSVEAPAVEEVEVEALDVDDSFWDDEDEPGEPDEADAAGADHDSDGEAESPAPQSAPETEASAESGVAGTTGDVSDPATVVLLDVDGTLCPSGGRGSWASWPDWYELDSPFGGPAGLSRTMLGRLGVLRDDDTELAWLTDWGDKANAFLAPRIAAGVRLPVWTDPKTGATGWWKVDALIDYVRTHPNLRRVCWIDDRLGDTGDEHIGAAKVGALLDRLGVEHLLVATDPAAGLTVGQLDAIEDWVAGREVTLPESTPFPRSEASSAGEDGSAEDPTEEIPAVQDSSPPSPSGTVLISEVDGALRDLFGGDPDPGLLREITRAETNGLLRFVWLTEWGESVNASLGRLLGGDPREVIPRQSGAGSAYGMWKLDAIESWMNANPTVKRIVWADPMLAQPAEMGFGTHADVAIRIARDRGVELVVADLSAGSLTPDDVRKAAGAPIADTESVHSGRCDRGAAPGPRTPYLPFTRRMLWPDELARRGWGDRSDSNRCGPGSQPGA